MTSQPQYYALQGGLDQESAAIAVPSGRAIGVLNHEAVSKGYQRTEGYERFDGKPAPSATQFWIGTFSDGENALAVGDIVNGQTSGATGRIIGFTLDSGSWGAGTAAGSFAIDNLTGAFTAGENLREVTTKKAEIVSIPALSDKNDSANALIWWQQAVDNRRNAIAKPPGQGPCRGVLWYEGVLYSWRDNVGATRCDLWKSSAAGWVAVDLGKRLPFTLGGPVEIVPGNVVTGSISGATGTVRYVALDTETFWDKSTAAGELILDGVTGTFVAETLNVGASSFVATIAGNAETVTFPAGGRYDMIVHNFYGATGFERAYGVNGVGKAFEFDGDSAIMINTGMPDDKPFLIAAHKKHLFLGFPKGSLQNSALGEPRSFTALLGAAEIGMGQELTNLTPNTTATLLVTTASSVAVLTGNDSSDFLLDTLSDEAGARAYTAQRIGNVIYMDERGIRSVAATQQYGNFKLGTYTSLIQATLENKRKLGVQPVASLVIKSKDQYLILFDDGSGISIYMGRKNPEAMLFQYPFVATSAPFVAQVDGSERVFVGADDGFVYELNVGPSFDGEEIEAFLQLPFGHQGSPRMLKRYHKALIECVCGPDTSIAVVAQFDYAAGYQPYAHGDVFGVRGSGGIWGLSNWAEFFWSAPTVAQAESYLQGAGENMSLIIFSKSKTMAGYILQGATIMFSPRGQKR